MHVYVIVYIYVYMYACVWYACMCVRVCWLVALRINYTSNSVGLKVACTSVCARAYHTYCKYAAVWVYGINLQSMEG